MTLETSTPSKSCLSPVESASDVPSMSPLDGESGRISTKRNYKRKRLARLVSQDQLGLVSSCDTIKNKSGSSFGDEDSVSSPYPQESQEVECPINDPRMIQTHLFALKLEAALQPMRLLLSRLMAHPTHNRKGIFNQPVDAAALGLVDYHLVVRKPMDLGTIKRRLYAVAYKSRNEVAEDIRLVFTNAMRYNPPINPVHKAARELLIYFEQHYMNMKTVASERRDASTTESESVAPSPLRQKPGLICVPIGRETLSTSPTTNAEEKETVIKIVVPPKKASKLPPFLPHSCYECKGRTCRLCDQGCLSHEPALLVCEGVHCGGAKIRKGSVYFVTRDGHRHFCQRCHTNLTPVLPGNVEGDLHCYKQDLLKRKSDEEIPEEWLTCSSCSVGVHAICAMQSGFLKNQDGFRCFDCQEEKGTGDKALEKTESLDSTAYTFVSGADLPVPLASLGMHEGGVFSASSLPSCNVSSFIEDKVTAVLHETPNAGKTISVRVISDTDRMFHVPEVVRRHFHMESTSAETVTPPLQVKYRQKAITLFQRIDGLDVCIFCMYVQEYDGDDVYEREVAPDVMPRHDKKVYIAYIDSVEHFRPRESRTDVYHEILVSYLATARARGYTSAQIWACPPSRGNSFIFWNHPASQRTPNRERLLEWYHGALSRAVDYGIVTDVQSLFETDFRKSELEVLNGRTVCPPLLEGDFWVEEANRIHNTHLQRNIKVRAPTDVCVWNVTPLSSADLDPCPAVQLAVLIKDRIMTHPSSVPFRRPVNAAAMKLKNYHKIVKEPMDLGTIYARCIIGEYQVLQELVRDVRLMVSNAKKFNPVGHFVHLKAEEVESLFFQELSALVKIWELATCGSTASQTWEKFSDMSMSLDKRMILPASSQSVNSSCVVIEDDRSSDGSRSMNSSVVSLSSSPISKEDESKSSQTESGMRAGKGKLRGRRNSSTELATPPKKLDLITDGPEAVMQRMVGEDFWLLDKRNPSGKAGGKRRFGVCDPTVTVQEPIAKRRKQSWIGEEVSEAIRRARTAFFTCRLVPKDSRTEVEDSKLANFESYMQVFASKGCTGGSMCSPISDSRHALLEFSQFRNFEFGTLRRAKYSTAMLLYHLKNRKAHGAVPVCDSCNRTIEEVRWHKVKKATEKRRATKFGSATQAIERRFVKAELCGPCHAQEPNQEEFIPMPVTLRL